MAGIFDFTARLVLKNFYTGLELKAGSVTPTAQLIAPFAVTVSGSILAVIFIDL